MCDFLLLLCAEFLLLWRNELLSMEFQEIIMFLQVRGCAQSPCCASLQRGPSDA